MFLSFFTSKYIVRYVSCWSNIEHIFQIFQSCQFYSLTKKVLKLLFWCIKDLLWVKTINERLRVFKHFFVLKLPSFFTHCVGEGKRRMLKWFTSISAIWHDCSGFTYNPGLISIKVPANDVDAFLTVSFILCTNETSGFETTSLAWKKENCL